MEMKIIPRISEKSISQAKAGSYIFNVPMTANKQQIATAVSKQFGVEVVTVNTVLAKGKAKRIYRKGGAVINGKKNDVKKAYVTLAEGQKIDAFEGEE